MENEIATKNLTWKTILKKKEKINRRETEFERKKKIKGAWI
jgi:hypothetical protein